MHRFVRKTVQKASAAGLLVKETSRSFILKCPSCGSDKLHLEREEGYFKCYSGKCGISGKSPTNLYALIRGIPFQSALKELQGENEQHTSGMLELGLDELKLKSAIEPVIDYPQDFVPATSREGKEGLEYCVGRGLTADILDFYGVMFSPILRRVVIPVRNEYGGLVGYQGRSIDRVDPSMRLRTSEGFKKDKFVMFLDKAAQAETLIVCEGPFDALKFHGLGGNVATMGKDLSDTQLNLLTDLPAKKIYWALDDDAMNLVTGRYASATGKQSYLVRVPEGAAQRIRSTGKDKVDFGECTPQECAQAISEAVMIGGRPMIRFGV